jgi:hypothetical protein
LNGCTIAQDIEYFCPPATLWKECRKLTKMKMGIGKNTVEKQD